jgi:hypothetical protein
MSKMVVSKRSEKRWWIPIMILFVFALACVCTESFAQPTPMPIFTPEPTPTPFPPDTPAASNETGLVAPEPPTPIPGAPAQQRQVSPEELVPHIFWGGWGGDPESCESDLPQIYLTIHGGGVGGLPERREYKEGDLVRIGEIVAVHGCNYPVEEAINVTFFLPDGTREQRTTNVSAFNEWWTRWWVLPNYPTGRYEVLAQSASATLSQVFQVSLPNRPIFTIDCFANEPFAYGVLAGFMPDEEVLMARYCCGMAEDDNLADYWYIQIGADGSALIELPRESALVVALGTQRPAEIFDFRISAYDYVLCSDR